MRHLKKGRKFGRTRDQRRAFLRTLLFQLVMQERLSTTQAKAKELAPLAERAISAARKGTLAARRRLNAGLPDAAVVKLIQIVAPRMGERRGGCTRIMKLPPRKSDASRMAIIEFVKE